MAMYTYDGTKDFLVIYPAIQLSFKASGSITAGKGVAFDAGNTGEVYQPTVAAGGAEPVGVCINTVADNGSANVVVQGFVKNLTAVAAYTPQPGDRIVLSGSGDWTSHATGSFLTNPYVVAGKVISGSGAGGRFMALINCLK